MTGAGEPSGTPVAAGRQVASTRPLRPAPDEITAIVLVLLENEEYLTDGYVHYAPQAWTCDDPDEPNPWKPEAPLKGYFPEDGAEQVLELVARRILAALAELPETPSGPTAVRPAQAGDDGPGPSWIWGDTEAGW